MLMHESMQRVYVGVMLGQGLGVQQKGSILHGPQGVRIAAPCFRMLSQARKGAIRLVASSSHGLVSSFGTSSMLCPQRPL